MPSDFDPTTSVQRPISRENEKFATLKVQGLQKKPSFLCVGVVHVWIAAHARLSESLNFAA